MACVPEGKIIGAISPVPLLQTETILQQMKKSVCRISCNKNHGTGFFCKIEQNKKKIPVLITNYHIIDDETVDSGEKIKCYLGDEKTLNLIKVDKNRKIYSSSINKYDIMILNIYDRDNIKNINYLELDDYLLTSNSFDRYESIYMLHYPSRPNITVSYGNGIEKKDKFSLKHKCYTSEGSSGAPILDLESNKVIGIHKGAGNRCQTQDKECYNLGTFLKDVIMDMNFQYINNINNNISKKDLNMLRNKKKSNNHITKIIKENRLEPKNYKIEPNKCIKQLNDIDKEKEKNFENMPNLNINEERKKNDLKNTIINHNQNEKNFYRPNLNYNNIKKDYLNNGININQKRMKRNEVNQENKKNNHRSNNSEELNSGLKLSNDCIQPNPIKKKYYNNTIVQSKYNQKKS